MQMKFEMSDIQNHFIIIIIFLPFVHSCDLQCADNRGTTPLHWAAAANQLGLVQLLLR